MLRDVALCRAAGRRPRADRNGGEASHAHSSALLESNRHPGGLERDPGRHEHAGRSAVPDVARPRAGFGPTPGPALRPSGRDDENSWGLGPPQISGCRAAGPWFWATRWYLTAGSSTMPVAIWPLDGALHLLPGRLAEAGSGSRRAPPAPAPGPQFRLGQQHVGARALQVDADPVAGLQQGQAAARRRFRRGVENRGRARGARLAAVADAGQGVDARPIR